MLEERYASRLNVLKKQYADSDVAVPAHCFCKQEFVRPRWPYDMRPSARAEKYIRDAGP